MPRQLRPLAIALAFCSAPAIGCGGGSGGPPMTVDAQDYEVPEGALNEGGGDEASPAPGRSGGGAILNPKDELFPQD
jgi:hypothetical protein